MELTFLGTSAGVPTRTRNMTSIVLNLQQPTAAEMWLFDCGEGTQHQFLHTPYHPGKLNKIFITHLHGDHLFGLPGLLCSRSMQGNSLPLTLYGPTGLREFVETALRLSGSWTDYPLTIVEVGPGLVFDEGGYRVSAYPLNHPVECYGYRIEEHARPALSMLRDWLPTASAGSAVSTSETGGDGGAGRRAEDRWSALSRPGDARQNAGDFWRYRPLRDGA